MKYRRLGNSGLKVSELSFGSWVTFGNQIDDKTADRLMTTAYDAGINFFDNAEAYAGGRSEEVMGRILASKQWPRETWCVSSKVFWGGDQPNQTGLSRKHVFEACHAALRRLQVEYLDLYFCHRPDPDTPIEETVAAMSDLIRQGKILYWGTSEWSAAEIMAAHAAAERVGGYRPTMEQPQYNLFERHKMEEDYSRIFADYGLGTTVWSPLASGKLTGKYLSGTPEDTRISLEGLEWLKARFEGQDFEKELTKIRRLSGLANDLGMTMPRLAIAWCLKNPNVSTVILGASKVSQLEENLLASDDTEKLSCEVLETIDSILA